METLKTTPDQEIGLILGNLVASLSSSQKGDLQDLLTIWDRQVLEAQQRPLSEDMDDLAVSIDPQEEEPRLKQLYKMIIEAVRQHKGNVRFMQVYRGLKNITQSLKI
jgi:hypothetical protein